MSQAIQIEAPDGSIVEFPAGTSDDIITSVMAKNFPAPQAEEPGTMEGITTFTASSPLGDQLSRAGRSIDTAVRTGVNALTFGMADRFAGAMDAATGRANSYREGVDAEHALTEARRKEEPGAALIGEIAGGVGGGAGLVKSGVTLAGRVGNSFVPRILGYGLEGAAYGGAHGAGHTYSEKPVDYLENAKKGATIGAMIGAGLPVAGSAAGGIYRLGSAFLGPSIEGAGRGASSLLRTAAIADEAGLRNLSRMGEEAMLVDAGPSMLGMGQGAGTGNGSGRTLLVNALRSRDERTGQRLAEVLDTNLGPTPVPSHIERDLHAGRNLTAEAYGPAMELLPRVDNRVLARELDIMIDGTRGPAQRALRQVREMLDIPGTDRLDRNPHTLLATRHAIDGMMTAEAANPQVVGQLTAARQLVDQRLARHVPEIKNVDARYEELSRQSDALKRGSQVFDTGKEAIRPVELAEEIERTALPGGLREGPPAARGVDSAFIGPSAAPFRQRQGARAELDRLVGTEVNDLLKLERTLATPLDWNSQKLGIMFGEDARNAVADAIRNNRQFRESYQRIAQNSATAQRTEAAASMKGAEGGNVPHDLTLTGLGGKAISLVAKAISGAANTNTRNQIGEVLSRQGPAAERVARELLQSANSSRELADAIARMVGSRSWISGSSPLAGRERSR